VIVRVPAPIQASDAPSRRPIWMVAVQSHDLHRVCSMGREFLLASVVGSQAGANLSSTDQWIGSGLSLDEVGGPLVDELSKLFFIEREWAYPRGEVSRSDGVESLSSTGCPSRLGCR